MYDSELEAWPADNGWSDNEANDSSHERRGIERSGNPTCRRMSSASMLYLSVCLQVCYSRVFVCRYGSDLVLVESYSENNYTAGLASRSMGPLERHNHHYWLGLASLDSLRTNTLESAAGVLVSQYAGFWSLSQPNPLAGECVNVQITDEHQSWELTTCESLLPFLCRASACPT
ncbi:unnamed protein product, partial [Timema podura]|nr:unnamed protein product [Timema podura]